MISHDDFMELGMLQSWDQLQNLSNFPVDNNSSNNKYHIFVSSNNP